MKRVSLRNGDSQQTEQQPQAPASAAENSLDALKTRNDQQKRRILPREMLDILKPSLEVGLGTGVAGMFSGAVFGIMRFQPPLITSIGAGVQWFCLGSSYYASRSIVDNAWGGRDQLTSTDKVKTSAISGGFAGTVGGLIRGPRNILPTAIVMTVVGAGGQAATNLLQPYTWRGFKTDFLASKWSPVTPISHQEYLKMLEEKLLGVEAEMAVLDDNIKALRAGSQNTEKQPENTASSTDTGKK